MGAKLKAVESLSDQTDASPGPVQFSKASSKPPLSSLILSNPSLQVLWTHSDLHESGHDLQSDLRNYLSSFPLTRDPLLRSSSINYPRLCWKSLTESSPGPHPLTHRLSKRLICNFPGRVLEPLPIIRSSSGLISLGRYSHSRSCLHTNNSFAVNSSSSTS